MKKILFQIVMLAVLFSSMYSQSQYGPNINDYRRQIFNTGSEIGGSELLGASSTSLIGKEFNTAYRLLYQWNIPENAIPNGSIINYVEINYLYTKHSYPSIDMTVIFRAFDTDISVTSPDFESIWNNWTSVPQMASLLGPENQVLTINSTQFPNMITALQNALTADKLVLGVFNTSEPVGINYYIPAAQVKLYVEYTPPAQTVTVRQKYSNGVEFGQVGHFEDEIFVNRASGHPYTFGISNTESFQAATVVSSNQKFNNWNADLSYQNYTDIIIEDGLEELTANFKEAKSSYVNNFLEGAIVATSGEISLKDPWLQDLADTKGTRNRGLNPIWKTEVGFDLTTTSGYQGIFLNQLIEEGSPYYSVQATSPQDIYLNQTGKTHKFYFQNWSATNAALQSPNSQTTAVVFTGANAEVKANLKGTQLTNSAEALASPSQRKFVRTTSGNMYTVYESMGKIWLERSTDEGLTWTIDNGGSPIGPSGASWTAKNPSLDYSTWTDLLTVVYEEDQGGGYTIIKLQHVFGNGSASSLPAPFDVGEGGIDAGSNLSPVVKVIQKESRKSDVVVVWADPGDHPEVRGKGLYYRVYEISETGVPIITETYNLDNGNNFLPGSNVGIPKNPTIQAIKTVTSGDKTYHIAWQNGDSEIEYSQLTLSSSGTISAFSAPEEASLGSGYTKNYSPSLVVMDDNLPRLTWVGEKEVFEHEGEGELSKSSGIEGTTIVKKVILRGRNSSYWNSGFWKYGNDPNSVSMNYNESGTIGGYAFAWSEGSPTISGHKSVTNTRINYSPVGICDAVGKDIHLCNGDAVNDMFTIGLDNTALPYELVRSEHIENLQHSCDGSQEKVLAANFQSVGREGLINYNQSVFFFELNDILLDGEVIEFEPLSDTTNFNDLISLNSYLESLPFEVNNNSQLAYSVKYGVVSEEEQILEEGDFINYKVQLVDNVNNEVLGTYDNVTFDENNLEVYDNVNYIIETEGIGSRTVKMKLVVDYNVEADPNLATIFCESNLLEKTGAVTLNYNGAGEITTYDLSQNYPNPFNPTTTIKYQIPSAGNVSLKIYDILGAEVMTLVNTTQAKGRYEVNFDASQLSSGVYIYRIQSNDYAASRKMMLLK